MDRTTAVLARAARTLRDDIRPALHRVRTPASLEAWNAPGEPVAFTEAVAQEFAPFAPGMPWGRPWGTTWLRISAAAPAQWVIDDDERLELLVDLGFTDARVGFQCEGLLWSEDGRPLKGVEPLQRSFPLPHRPGDGFIYYLEAAANPDIAQGFQFVTTALGDRGATQGEPLYRLGRVEVTVRHLPTWELIQDLTALTGLAAELSPGGRRDEIVVAIEDALNAIDPLAVRDSATAARGRLASVLARPASASAHRIHAVGHAHIDSAWLWPIRETRRKVARSFANVLALMDRHPELTFAASSAQQWAWVKSDYPDLYERVRQRVAEGRFIPTGGQWVEPDCNLPSGESLARQLIEGKRFFLEEFGIDSPEVWIPDSFGYSAALPQIASAAGSRYFLTQKISWNETNTFPHHSFLWEGIDGTRIFTHFPSADTYHAQISAQELFLAESQFADRGRTDLSLLPFGWGDGGGGPTEEMLASAERFADLEGAPRVSLSTPEQFFTAAAADYDDPPVWVGELYLERHRGVSTTQIELKRGNRLAERMLREAEYWCTVASVRRGAVYPADTLRRIWQDVLLLQFHDILPGSSITWVHREAAEKYEALRGELTAIIESAVRALLGDGSHTVQLNAGPLPNAGVLALGATGLEGRPRPASDASARELDDDRVEIANGRLRVVFAREGNIESVFDIAADRELIPAGTPAGILRLHHDTPTTWDAWDLDDHYADRIVPLPNPAYISAFGVDEDGASASIDWDLGASTARIHYRLAPDAPRLDISIDLDWHEDRKLLKYVLPLDIHADRAAAEVGYGHVFRPTHTNTSWEEARFEVVAHRWLHVGENGYGASLANESTYGYSVTREGGSQSVHTVIGVSLARAPRYPDPESDRGRHRFAFTLRPGAGIAEAVAEGYRLNVPIREVTRVGGADIAPLVRVDAPGVMVEAVKLADDSSGDVIVRLYEAHGARSRGRITWDFAARSAHECDLLERAVEPRAAGGENRLDGYAFELRPFQLMTLRISREGAA